MSCFSRLVTANTLSMIMIVEDALHHALDRASFVESTIDVVYRDQLSKQPGGQLVPLNKCNVHKKSGGPTI